MPYIKTYTIDGVITIKDKDLYKFLWGKLRPLTEFRKWEEEVMKDLIGKVPKEWERVCWTLDGWDNPRNAWRFFSIKKCIEIADDMEKKEILWNLS
jgi:hypothetical protein